MSPELPLLQPAEDIETPLEPASPAIFPKPPWSVVPTLLLNVFLVPLIDPCFPQHPAPFTPKSGFLFSISQLDPSPVPSQLRGLYQFSGSVPVPTWYVSARRGVRCRTKPQKEVVQGQRADEAVPGGGTCQANHHFSCSLTATLMANWGCFRDPKGQEDVVLSGLASALPSSLGS